jgi:hypothetical protein
MPTVRDNIYRAGVIPFRDMSGRFLRDSEGSEAKQSQRAPGKNTMFSKFEFHGEVNLGRISKTNQ